MCHSSRDTNRRNVLIIMNPVLWLFGPSRCEILQDLAASQLRIVAEDGDINTQTASCFSLLGFSVTGVPAEHTPRHNRPARPASPGPGWPSWRIIPHKSLFMVFYSEREGGRTQSRETFRVTYGLKSHEVMKSGGNLNVFCWSSLKDFTASVHVHLFRYILTFTYFFLCVKYD